MSCFFTTVLLEVISLFHSSEVPSGGGKDWNQAIDRWQGKSDFKVLDLVGLVSVNFKSNNLRMNVTSSDFFILSIVKDHIAVFQKNAGLSSNFVIRSKERFKVGFIDCELVFGGVLKNQRISRSNVKDYAGFLGKVFAMGLAFDDVVDDCGYAWHELNSDQNYYSAFNRFKFTLLCNITFSNLIGLFIEPIEIILILIKSLY